jgi:hypothetical protein
MEQMLRSFPAIARTVLAACAVILLSVPSYGGEAFSERDELDNGPSFFGEAKEVRSLRSIPKVQVKAELGQRRISTYTNAEGHFKIPSFGKETVADSVTITCAKEGYRTLDISRRRMSTAADAPIEIECLLEPTP